MEELSHFQKLYEINCNEKTEKKNNGSTELTYLSWTYAWSEVKKIFPNAKYEILKFGDERLPYVFDEKTGYMVFTKVEIEGIEHEMWLPVMDSANKAMKDKPYNYKVAKWEWQNQRRVKVGEVEKTVESATMFDINKTIMRCLTKNLAMFGLGLYIYAGEDLPESIDSDDSPKNKTNVNVKNKEVMITEQQKEIIKKIYTQDEIKEYLLDVVEKKKLSDLTLVEASDFIRFKNEEEK